MKKLLILSALMLAFMIWIQSCEDAINSEDNILKKPDNGNTQQNDTLDKLGLTDIDFPNAITGRENYDTTSCITNTSDSIEIVISSLEITGPDANAFEIIGLNLPIVLAPKERYCLLVSFHPEETRSYEAKIIVNKNEDYYIHITGEADKFLLDYLEFSSGDFGLLDLDFINDKKMEFCITNTHKSKDIKILSFYNINSSFIIEGQENLPVSIPPGEKYCMNIVFKPNSTGTFAGKVNINSHGLYYFTLKGKAINSNLNGFHFDDVDFGTMNLGDVKDYNYCFTNNSADEINIYSLDIDNSAFRFADNINYPLQIMPDQEYCIRITFDPPAAGTYEGKIIINDNPETFIRIRGIAE